MNPIERIRFALDWLRLARKVDELALLAPYFELYACFNRAMAVSITQDIEFSGEVLIDDRGLANAWLRAIEKMYNDTRGTRKDLDEQT